MPNFRERAILFIASTSAAEAADSILDTASVAVRTLKKVTDYAKDHGLKPFRVTIEEIEGEA